MKRFEFFVGAAVLLAIGASAPLAQAAVTFGRDKLKGSTKTQGDYNLRFSADSQSSIIKTAYNVGHKFSVEIDGKEASGVQSVEGIETEHEVVEYKDPEDMTMRTRPGNKQIINLTITREMATSSDSLSQQIAPSKSAAGVVDGKTDRKSISVIFQNDAGAEPMRLDFSDCSLVKAVTLPSFNARNSGHATESLEIQCDSGSQ